jgi:hypothetical protein
MSFCFSGCCDTECETYTSCFGLRVCDELQPNIAIAIAGAELDRTPTGETASGSTGAAGEPFCHGWAVRPFYSLVEFAWKDCNLAAYLPTACNFDFVFDVCIARGITQEAYDILDDSTIAGVQTCCFGLRVGPIPWDDGLGPCVPSPTTGRDVYWWNVHPSYAAAGLDCPMTYGVGVPPSTMSGVRCSTTGFIVGSSPSEYAPYIWECTHNYDWCCEDDATFRMGGLPVDDPGGLWSFYPCRDPGPWLLVAPGTDVYGGWGCPGCRAADDMEYHNLNAWALNVAYDFSFTYYYPADFPSTVASHSVTMSGTLPFDCPPYAIDGGVPAWDSGAITVSWPAGYYYLASETVGVDPPHIYNVTSIRIVFGGTLPDGYGYMVIQALANDIPPGGFAFSGCDRAPIRWTFTPDAPDDIFVTMTEGSPPYGGECDHHIDWSGTAAEPYTPTTCRLYGTASVTGPV